jgi:hypothetical protein
VLLISKRSKTLWTGNEPWETKIGLRFLVGALPVIDAIVPVPGIFRPCERALVTSAIIAKLKSIRRTLFAEPDDQFKILIREPSPPGPITPLSDGHFLQHRKWTWQAELAREPAAHQRSR